MSEYVFKTDSPIKTCGECPCFHAENPMYCQVDKNIKMTCPYAKRMEHCPLKELPPHGRLIDADEAKDTMMIEMCGTGYQTKACHVLDSDFYTPTVLEASEK